MPPAMLDLVEENTAGLRDSSQGIDFVAKLRLRGSPPRFPICICTRDSHDLREVIVVAAERIAATPHADRDTVAH